MSELKKIYETLHLGDFEPVRASVEGYLREQKDYQTNQHELDAETLAKLKDRWGFYADRYGYDLTR